MTKKSSDCKQIVQSLECLHKKFPTYNIGRHIATALDGYDVWGISDREFVFALTKYAAELEFDIPHEAQDIDHIIEEAMHLDSILNEDNGDE